MLGFIGLVLVGSTLATKALAVGRTQSKQVSTSKIRGGYDLKEKLDEIIESQQVILGKFDEALAELQIAKTRATRRRCP